jgi:hypothetical protein
MNVSAILATILHPTAMPNPLPSLLAAALALATTPFLAAGEAARPNIILIMVD